MHRAGWVFGSVAALAAAGPAVGQAANRTGGFWVSAGGGTGTSFAVSYRPRPDDLGTDAGLSALTGGAWFVRMGGTPARDLRVGAEVIQVRFPLGTGQRLQRTNIAAVVVARPRRFQGLVASAAVGAADMEWPGDDRAGIGASVALGVERRVRERVYLTAEAVCMTQAFTTAVAGAALVTLALSWR